MDRDVFIDDEFPQAKTEGETRFKISPEDELENFVHDDDVVREQILKDKKKASGFKASLRLAEKLQELN